MAVHRPQDSGRKVKLHAQSQRADWIPALTASGQEVRDVDGIVFFCEVPQICGSGPAVEGVDLIINEALKCRAKRGTPTNGAVPVARPGYAPVVGVLAPYARP